MPVGIMGLILAKSYRPSPILVRPQGKYNTRLGGGAQVKIHPDQKEAN